MSEPSRYSATAEAVVDALSASDVTVGGPGETGVLELSWDTPRFGWSRIQALAAAAGILIDTPVVDSVRAVLLTGGETDFSHGADLTDPELAQRMQTDAGRREVAATGQRMVGAWDGLPIPTVAAARGRVLGAGACLFLASDFRFAAEGAELGFPEVDRGMHLSWGVLPVLHRECGAAGARELAVLGRPVAATRFALPPVAPRRGHDDPSRGFPGDSAAAGRALAGDLAAKPPLAVRSILEVLRELGAGVDPATAAANDPGDFAHTVGSADFAEAMAAYFEGRTGRYRGR